MINLSQVATGSPQIEPPDPDDEDSDVYITAKNSGKHSGFYKQHANLSQKELERRLNSLQKKIDTHQQLIRSPEQAMKELGKGDWKLLDPR